MASGESGQNIIHPRQPHTTTYMPHEGVESLSPPPNGGTPASSNASVRYQQRPPVTADREPPPRRETLNLWAGRSDYESMPPYPYGPFDQYGLLDRQMPPELYEPPGEDLSTLPVPPMADRGHQTDDDIPEWTVNEGTGEPHPTQPARATHHVPHSADSSGDARLQTTLPLGMIQPVPPPMAPSYTGPIVTPYGTVALVFDRHIRVDMTVDGALRVINYPAQCIAAVNGSGDRASVLHPCAGRVLQSHDDISISTGNKLARISRRGVTFTALNHGLVYLVDPSGTKSTTERFRVLSQDMATSVFYEDACYGSQMLVRCLELVSKAEHQRSPQGTQSWRFNGVLLRQTNWGDVRVSKDDGQTVIWTSPTDCTISVKTYRLQISASTDRRRHLFVKSGNRSVTAAEAELTVKNGSQKAGFDPDGRLVLP